jgi:organic hydroperoxide reductase OsmC/OhrA
MTTIYHPSAKDQNQIIFDVRLDWLEDLKGILTANDAKGPIYVATPPAFGGEAMDWSPEHLFLGSISSCFMTTYLHFVRKLKFSISHIECRAVGQVELVNGKYAFTHISIFPIIHVADATQMESAELALLKTQKYCLISNSIKPEVDYHGKIKKTE